nr:hypothetical protein [uncultured Prevotella sp.]
MYPQDNIFKLYYQIGRALPFEVRRFPNGRVSDWYRSQSVLVTKISPRRQYGEAWGFYLQNGERADSYWCKKSEGEPQPIPCCGCGGWVLVDVKGEPTTKPDYDFHEKVEASPCSILKPEDMMRFGKYKGKTIKEVFVKDKNYLVWATSNVADFFVDWELLEESLLGKEESK